MPCRRTFWKLSIFCLKRLNKQAEPCTSSNLPSQDTVSSMMRRWAGSFRTSFLLSFVLILSSWVWSCHVPHSQKGPCAWVGLLSLPVLMVVTLVSFNLVYFTCRYGRVTVNFFLSFGMDSMLQGVKMGSSKWWHFRKVFIFINMLIYEGLKAGHLFIYLAYNCYQSAVHTFLPVSGI